MKTIFSYELGTVSTESGLETLHLVWVRGGSWAERAGGGRRVFTLMLRVFGCIHNFNRRAESSLHASREESEALRDVIRTPTRCVAGQQCIHCERLCVNTA